MEQRYRVDEQQLDFGRRPRTIGPSLGSVSLFVVGLAVCVASTIYYLVRVLQLKFNINKSQGCNLNTTKEEDAWTLRQILTMLMLVGLFLPAREICNGMFLCIS